MSHYPIGPFIGKAGKDGRFEQLREDFLLDFRERTARAYKADLQDFFEWCQAHSVKPLTASAQEVQAYAKSLSDRGYAEATTTRREATVLRFLKHVESKPDAGQ